MRTGFERRIGERGKGRAAEGEVAWTSLEEEAAFLEALAAASERVRVWEVARTSEGRPLWLARVGAAEVTDGRAVLFVGLQHGDEPAAREGCLAHLRDLALSADPAVAAYLREHAVCVLPTANPDGRVADTRENALGIDLNRDHLDPVTPEGLAIQRLIRDLRPGVVADMHEYNSRGELHDRELLSLWPRHRNVDPRIHALSRNLSVDHLEGGTYGILELKDLQVAQDAGHGDERTLRNVAGLRHAVTVLIESDRNPNRRHPSESEDGAAVQARRVASQVGAGRDVVRFHRQHADTVTAAVAGARERAVTLGRAADRPLYVGGADNALPGPRHVLYPPPCAYRLTQEQARRLSHTLAAHGIAAEATEGSMTIVSMAQPGQPLIPLLLDGRAEHAAVAGQPLP